MNRYGYAIRTGGDAEIATALAEGIARGTRRDIRQHGSDAVRRVAMAQHTPEEWAAMTVQARYDYGQDPTPGRLGRALLAGYALICYVISWAYRQQDKVLGR